MRRTPWSPFTGRVWTRASKTYASCSKISSTDPLFTLPLHSIPPVSLTPVSEPTVPSVTRTRTPWMSSHCSIWIPCVSVSSPARAGSAPGSRSVLACSFLRSVGRRSTVELRSKTVATRKWFDKRVDKGTCCGYAPRSCSPSWSPLSSCWCSRLWTGRGLRVGRRGKN